MSERASTLLGARIIAIAITIGPTLFLGVVLFLVNRAESPLGNGETAPLLSQLSLGLAIAAVTTALTIPKLVAAKQPNPYDSYRVMVILRCAILEAPALLGCVAYMLEGNQTPLGAGVALGMILILAGLTPTGSRLDAWVSEQSASRDAQ